VGLSMARKSSDRQLCVFLHAGGTIMQVSPGHYAKSHLVIMLSLTWSLCLVSPGHYAKSHLVIMLSLTWSLC